MDEIDLIFKGLAKAPIGYSPTIACLFTGRNLPSSCAPMLRSPAPPIGQALDPRFADHLKAALELNEAIHDGAILFGRESEGANYHLAGWSYRLYPRRSAMANVPNRGSAFNSCISMSVVKWVDRLYLVAQTATVRFENGLATQI